jgi:hypothetical protein
MDAHTAQNTALDNHPLYQEVLSAIKAAVEASPPQFKCEVHVGSDEPYGTVQALTAKLRSDFYGVEYDRHTYFLSIDWCSARNP